MTRRRLLGGLLAAGLIVLLMALVGTFWLLTTKAGRDFALEQAVAAVPGEASIGEADGVLAGPLVLHDLQVAATAGTVSIDRIELDWAQLPLLAGRVRINHLRVRGVFADLPAAETAAPGERTPSAIDLPNALTLPIPVEIRRLDLGGVHVQQGGRVLGPFGLALSAEHDGRHWRLKEIAATSPWGGGTGHLRVDGRRPFALDSQLDWLTYPGTPGSPLAGRLTLGGDLQTVELDFGVHPPGPIDLAGTVEPLRAQPAWNLALRVTDFAAARWHPQAPAWPIGADLRIVGDLAATRVHGNVQAQDTPAGTAEVAVDTTVGPTAATIDELTLQFDDGGAAAVDGRVDWSQAGAPEWDLAVGLDALDAAPWDVGIPAWPLSGDLRVSGDLEATRVTGELGVTDTPIEGVNASVDAEVRPDGARVDRLAVQLAASEAQATASGDLSWAGAEPSADLALRWRDLAWPLDGAAGVSPRGELDIEGTPSAYEVRGDVVGGPTAYPEGEWRLLATGNTGGLSNLLVTGDWVGAQWRLQGALAWAQALAGQLELDVDDLDPGALGAPLAGAMAGTLEADWELASDGPVADVRLQRLEGQLAGHELTGRGGARIRGETIALDEIEVRAGDSVLVANGGVSPEADLAFRLALPDLSRFVADAGGSLQAKGGATGAWPDIALDLDLAGDGLVWADTAVERLRVEATLPVARDAPADVDASIAGVEQGRETLLERASLTLNGSRLQHNLELAVERDEQAVYIDAEGGMDDADRNWSGAIRRFELRPALGPTWVLDESASLRAGLDEAVVERLCLTPLDQQAGRACINGRWAADDGDWAADAQVAALPFAPWARLLVPDLEVSGALDLDAQARGTGGDLAELALDADIGAGAAFVAESDERQEVLAWENGEVQARGDGNELTLDADLPLAPDGVIALRLRTGLRGEPRPISGNLRVQTDRIRLVSLLVPEIGRIEGRADLDLDLAGTVTEPALDGKARLDDGVVTLPRLGLQLTETTLDFGAEEGRVNIEAGARSGDGQLAITADAERQEGTWRVDGTLRGEDFRVMDTTEVRADVTPNIDWSVADREIRVNGDILVPWARLEPRDLSGAVQPSGDVERVDAGREQPDADDEAGWQVYTNVDAELGDDVRFDGFGLVGNIEGALNLRDRPGRPTTARGEIQVVDGTYSAYQQKLQVERGRLIYNGGSVTDPGLDIRAIRRPRNVIVGVNVRGTLREPDVTLFSEPSMQQSQILSYLVLGIPLNETGSGDRSALASVAKGAGGWVAKQVGGRIGIDDVEIREGENQDDAELVLGTYLHPRLYVSYGVGLFETFSRVRLEYSLSERWSVEGESGPASSADLLYRLER